MPASSVFRSKVPLIVGLVGLLVVVAVLQDRSIGGWSEVEDIRLHAALAEGAQDLDAALTERIAKTGEPFVELQAAAGGIADSLATRLGELPADALPIRDVFWVDPGPTPALRRLDPDARFLLPADWSDLGPDWRRYFTREADALRPGAPMRMDNAEAPVSSAALAFPALPRPASPAPYIVLALDSTALVSSVLPPLLRDHLRLGDAFDVIVGPSGGPPLYTSRPDLGVLDHPDLVRPVGARLLTALTVTLSDEAGERVLEVNQGEIAPGSALWELRVRHRAGSIAAATDRLRWQQRALAFAVLALLAGAVALLVRSALAQRALAERQLAFVAGVSHELRTPLAVLGSAGENLADGVTTDPSEIRTYGALIRDESRRLSDTVESILALGGVEAQRVPDEPVSLAEVAHEATEAARAALRESGTTLTVELAPDVPPLHADRRAVVAAVRNLLVNAARHGGTSAVLAVRPVENGVEIAVEDDGAYPLPEADLFEPFTRGSTDGRGSGLGLALVRRVAEHYGGTATLTRTPDGRTRALLTLPV